jgi:hypothetical protein
VVVINGNWSLSLILYCIRYFYLANRASKILVGEECLVLIDAKTVPALEITGVIVVWLGVSEAALVFAHARLTGASLEIEVISRLLFATFWTSFCFHGYAPYGRL